MGETF